MSRPILKGVDLLQSWFSTAPSRATRLVKGEGTPGTRAGPTQTVPNDTNIGVRLDNAEKITKDGQHYKRYKLQPNKNAANVTLKELANKNSHQVLAEADMSLDESIPSLTRFASFFDALRQNVENRWKGGE
ncbi:hypothetical protein McanMca71_007877 [Microsporum canis]|uniref:Uncharacterized protein n=1 Tax=Arthroderma otae (strain ATCC MYA-4605 / CBS 113480) TaxID=554155 RepID=C5FPI3_ARTOC|nr:conserved hypothetical protein [Microsporum canis CBS 113480]EEQ31499.1 conserved hypothetical protein [Microsporum canis CBS 113480]